jgi:hypothetical protein
LLHFGLHLLDFLTDHFRLLFEFFYGAVLNGYLGIHWK